MTIELKVGRVYRAKKRSISGFYLNDRQIKWIAQDGSLIQYDAPAVANGRKFPTVAREAFEKWVGSDVTDQLPPGEWETWR